MQNDKKILTKKVQVAKQNDLQYIITRFIRNSNK